MTDSVAHVHDNGGNSFGFMVGMILLFAFIFFLFFYGLPVLRNNGSNQQSPQIQQQSPDIKVPEKIDINVNK